MMMVGLDLILQAFDFKPRQDLINDNERNNGLIGRRPGREDSNSPMREIKFMDQIWYG